MTHTHEAIGERCTPIGDTACLTPRQGGYWFCHDVDGSTERCIGGVNTVPDRDRPTWGMSGTLEGGDLTLDPSLRCVTDGFHGWVRKGAWVPT